VLHLIAEDVVFCADNRFSSGAAISSFKIPFGNKEEVKPIYIQEFNLAVKGPKPGQEQSRPHQVFVGPKNSFLLSPDLGMDLVHVFRIDKQSGKLNDCMSPIEFDKGSGPRHGVFVTSGGNHTRQLTVRHKGLPQKPHAEHTRLYVVEELGYKLCPFDVSYAGDGCPKFKKLDCFTPYPGSALPVNATLSEIQAAGQNLYVSIRSDKKFEGKDSLATLTLAKNGSVVLDGLHSSGGSVPRTFVLNQKGDLVAVGNQVSSNVVIVERNPETGKLGKEVASLQVGKVGTPGKGDGLSSLVWYEKGC
jgi:6-phosphogluconolactonase (cycloisomerase 2 family)